MDGAVEMTFRFQFGRDAKNWESLIGRAAPLSNCRCTALWYWRRRKGLVIRLRLKESRRIPISHISNRPRSIFPAISSFIS